ncbi:hypothetical protein CIB95_10945 [Lottiidibacillus patelloidae]|uniref:Lipoprotein n=2 Tax=Lottiidibacillus patelloidae TaxID=2670334 RepID=A0A263BSN8_9BACI|nr:hypothetical protein CIB95_10945 [Lottiidibacillus patelloidae]
MKNKLLIALFVLGVFVTSCGLLNMLNSKINYMYSYGALVIGIVILAIPVGYVKWRLGKLWLTFKNGQDFKEVMASLIKYEVEFGSNYSKKNSHH